jgi:hypothetical protein
MDNEKILYTKLKYGTSNEYINDLTKFMDNMIAVNEHPKFCSSYLCISGHNDISIRFPGATRGGIEVDSNNVITNIVLDEEYCFDKKQKDMRFKIELKEEIKKFIGYKIVITSDKEEYENPTGVDW